MLLYKHPDLLQNQSSVLAADGLRGKTFSRSFSQAKEDSMPFANLWTSLHSVAGHCREEFEGMRRYKALPFHLSCDNSEGSFGPALLSESTEPSVPIISKFNFTLYLILLPSAFVAIACEHAS